MIIYNKMNHEDTMAIKDLNRLKLEREQCEHDLSRLNNKLVDVEMGFGHKLCKLRNERKRLETIYWGMKERVLKESVKVDQNRLRELATVSDQSRKVR